MAIVSQGGDRPTAGIVLEATTPYGRHWSSDALSASTRMVDDPGRLLAEGDVITVHDTRTKATRFLLRVTGRDGDRALLSRLARG